jgi:hypothetical protein
VKIGRKVPSNEDITKSGRAHVVHIRSCCKGHNDNSSSRLWQCLCLALGVAIPQRQGQSEAMALNYHCMQHAACPSHQKFSTPDHYDHYCGLGACSHCDTYHDNTASFNQIQSEQDRIALVSSWYRWPDSHCSAYSIVTCRCCHRRRCSRAGSMFMWASEWVSVLPVLRKSVPCTASNWTIALQIACELVVLGSIDGR